MHYEINSSYPGLHKIMHMNMIMINLSEVYPICKPVKGKMQRSSSPFLVKTPMYELLITQIPSRNDINVCFKCHNTENPTALSDI